MLTLLLALALQVDRPAPVGYTLTYFAPSDTRAHVRIHLPAPVPAPASFVFPRGYPGGYSIVHYDNFVENLRGLGAVGTPPIAHSWVPKRAYGVGYSPFTWEMPPIIDTIWFNEGFGRYASIAALAAGMPGDEGPAFRARARAGKSEEHRRHRAAIHSADVDDGAVA